MFVVDPKTDEIAVKEARKLRIPVIAICDTNVDPDMVDFVIPANDDIAEAVNLIVNNVIEAYADAAGIKMQPSNLKTVAPKREERAPRSYNNNYNSNYTPREAANNDAPKAEKPAAKSE
ncbi:hypothetical protein Zmor_003978 [Zophobas morio]|uniref:30S ribosomal protein S2 n=1 Tax=Zophobas morio TaxID=2755281 RepID=A0AA38M179_9CUCU|nr:hypothetical protein Zmor_003978 [Zophobas morio]